MNFDFNILVPGLLGILLGSVATWAWVSKSAKRRAILQLEAQARAHIAEVQHLHKEQDLALANLSIKHQGLLSAAMAHASRSRDASLNSERNLLAERYESQIQALKLQHEEQIRKVTSPLTVDVHPFADSIKDKGWLRKTSTVEIGYQYQLMIHGLPCMEPHRLVVEKQTVTEVDSEAMKGLYDKATKLAEAYFQLKGGQAAGNLFKVVKDFALPRKNI